MGSITMHPSAVRSWGSRARACGDDVRTSKAHVTQAETDMASACVAGMASKVASQHYTDGVEKGVATVADSVHDTGDKLVQTATMVSVTDDESANPFHDVGGYEGHR